MRCPAFVAFTALLATAPGAAQRQPTEPEPGLVTYVCESRGPMPGSPDARLALHKVFLEDGTVHRQSVEMIEVNSFVRSRVPGEQILVVLKWPGDHRFRPVPEPFSLADGSVGFMLMGPAAHRHSRREVWRQTVIDRDNRARIEERDGVRMLMPDRMGVTLAGPLDPILTGHVTASIDALLAWGHGVDRLTAYLLHVQRRRYRRNSFPNDQIGPQRIAGQYEIDMAGFERRVAEVRAAATTWENGLGHYRTCRREIEYPDQESDIMITSGATARPTD